MSTLKYQLEDYLKGRALEWVHKGVILNVVFRNSKNGIPYLSDTVANTLRKLQRECKIAVKPDINNKSVLYKWLPPDRREFYIPTSERTDNKLFI